MVSLPPAEEGDRLVALAVHPLAHHLAMAAHRLRLLARLALRGLLVVAAQLHLPEDALALHLLLERAPVWVDIVVANQNLHVGRLSCSGRKKRPPRRQLQLLARRKSRFPTTDRDSWE